ncbi:Calcium/proton exchanger CAX domain-containing protein [Rozella allomycis CSF55]|uniref:Vacuolar calcium ion transporter n=2 Tax=Rozella allomycis (strain CSF55) TaxID=988480 RepID=A0A075AN03_ROZAC|nr:Calcium/proton exchanger CAX domain-containing protein [Rozella allomycis CSF55]|eukprot:EPZ31149.1 Calcium/proton exchanger CAX domain-containing protein [Rozella allomycis CSF55]
MTSNDNTSLSPMPLIGSSRHHVPASTATQTKELAKSMGFINLFLITLPFAIIGGAVKWPPTIVFILNFIAIVPLAKLLGIATEEIAFRTSQSIGGLLNASFGNAVEMILSIVALKEGLIRVVQASLLGSILSNLLLVLGFCFVAGGLKHKEQRFNMTAAQTSSSLMTMSVMSLLVPAAMMASSPAIEIPENNNSLLALSHGTAIILLCLYILYLIFQLRTHVHLYADDEGDEEEEPILSVPYAISLLVIVTILVSVCAEFLVGSIEVVSSSWGLSETFIGLILLPIVGNAAEHVTAVTVAMKNKMNLAIGVAIGSSMQIALFVTPFLVIVGWFMGQNLTLFFHTFETSVMFISVLIVNYLIQDGTSNWLEGNLRIQL